MPTKTKSDLIIPSINAVALDTTEYWEGPLPEKAGKIYDIHLYDEGWRVHACSFRAMHELWWTDVITMHRLNDEDQSKLRYHATEMDVTYVATTDIGQLREAEFPEGMFETERTKHFLSPPENVWREQVTRKGKQDAHNDLMRHAIQAYCENPLF